jgi:hypothetical protein
MSDSEVLCLGLAERWVALGRARRWELLAQAEAAHAWRSCHQAGENGCSCQHTWHILGTGLRAKDFEPASFPCLVRKSHTICQSLTEKLLRRNLPIPSTHWLKTLLPTQDRHNKCRCLTALPMGRTMDKRRSAIRLFAIIEACPYTVGCRGLQDIQPPLWMISAYLPTCKTALMLNPFCGVGTTLLQAVLRRHYAIGFEIHHYPVSICKK